MPPFIVCVFAMLLFVVHATRVAGVVIPSSELSESPSKCMAVFYVGVSATRLSRLIFTSGDEVLSWSESC